MVSIVAHVYARAVDSGRTFLLLGCVTGTSVDQNIGLGGAASLSMVVIYGVLEVDFFCYLFLKIAVFWPGIRVPVVGFLHVAPVVLSRCTVR